MSTVYLIHDTDTGQEYLLPNKADLHVWLRSITEDGGYRFTGFKVSAMDVETGRRRPLRTLIDLEGPHFREVGIYDRDTHEAIIRTSVNRKEPK